MILTFNLIIGDLTEGCKTAGPHYNPEKKKHGGPMDNERHVGDLGNLKTDEKVYIFIFHKIYKRNIIINEN